MRAKREKGDDICSCNKKKINIDDVILTPLNNTKARPKPQPSTIIHSLTLFRNYNIFSNSISSLLYVNHTYTYFTEAICSTKLSLITNKESRISVFYYICSWFL